MLAFSLVFSAGDAHEKALVCGLRRTICRSEVFRQLAASVSECDRFAT
jgi:hypothetical protein